MASRPSNLQGIFSSHLRAEADLDYLTGLAKRRRFRGALGREVERWRRYGVPCALLMLDIDHLKVINDQHGHPVGDTVIRHIGNTLLSVSRENDTAARLGGEEFALLLASISGDKAALAAERLRRSLAERPVEGVGKVTVSIGVAACPLHASSERSLYAAGDRALYVAKNKGPLRVGFSAALKGRRLTTLDRSTLLNLVFCVNVVHNPKSTLTMETKTPQPDALGHWGQYGGRYVPETLMAPLDNLTEAFMAARADQAFQAELETLLHDYAGRPSPLFHAARLSECTGGAKIYLKREDLLHTGAHKINNTLGQVLLARRMGKRRIIAETGAGQHGVATATVCALFGLDCVVYMGAEDMQRQALNVFRMELLGAEVRQVDRGSRTLKDAINEALRDWVTNVADTYYLLGSALGPHPYPLMVREFQRVIGCEARAQILEHEGRLPDVLIACVGGGSNSIGLFHPFLDDTGVRMIGVEAGGLGDQLGQHAARFNESGGGRPGVLQGTMSYVLQDNNGQIAATHSVSAGLDYPSIGPEHAFLHDAARVEYVSVCDTEALDAFQTLSRLEGIIPALESAHAVAQAMKCARELKSDQLMIVNLSGRGDKDVNTVAEALMTGSYGEAPTLGESMA